MISKQIPIDNHTNEIFKNRYLNECKRVNRFMIWLMIAQWFAGIAFAVFYSPVTWIGQSYAVHVHVWASILLGGAISGFAILWTKTFPESAHTRHVVAITQMLWSALLIHLTGGRIETHFHVFASLAILSIYRDWKILITATVVVAVDHFIRGVFYPLSAFGVVTESPYRWIEHAAWVIFEVSFLAPGCMRLRNEIRELCVRQTEIEEAKKSVEKKVRERTSEIASKGKVIEESLNEIFIFDATTFKFLYVNRGGRSNIGYSLEELQELTPLDIKPDFSLDSFRKMVQPLQSGEEQQILFQTVHLRKDGSDYVAEIRLQRSRYQDRDVFLAMILDITERIDAENRNSQLQRELVDASRKAGMADVATGVLHNVGNILNSVNISAALIRKKFQNSALSNLEKASCLITDHKTDFGQFVSTDDRGKKLPNYIVMATEALKQERGQIDVEFDDLIKNIEHIKDVITVQQSMAKSSGLNQLLSATELVNDSVTANKGTLLNHRVKVTTDVEENLPSLVSDKHKILQILINLIRNAKDAVVENNTPNPEIKIAVRRTGDNILFQVIDNGIGVVEEKLDQIFQHGFTTKESGHGFGLHSSANSATQLGGALTVSSPGIGQGAVFQLRVPIRKSEPEQNTTSLPLAARESFDDPGDAGLVTAYPIQDRNTI